MSENRIRGNPRELSWESTKGNQFGARRTIHLLLFEGEKNQVRRALLYKYLYDCTNYVYCSVMHEYMYPCHVIFMLYVIGLNLD